MNILSFDPAFLQPAKMPLLLRAFRITEVFNLMPHDADMEEILASCQEVLTINRKPHETMDETKRRAVYRLAGKISTPIIAHSQWTGHCEVADLYQKSNSENFVANLSLDDPNTLIFRQTGPAPKEESTINILTYLHNILRKHSTIDYKRRICATFLSKYITLEDTPSLFRGRALDKLEAPAKVLRDYLHIPDPNHLAEALLTKEGIKERREIILCEQQERRDAAAWDTGASADDWGQAAEMDYIRGNGGDWIDD